MDGGEYRLGDGNVGREFPNAPTRSSHEKIAVLGVAAMSWFGVF